MTFEPPRSAGLALVLILGGLGGCASCGGSAPEPAEDPAPAEPERPPNVLILLWDTVRADHMSVYGYGRKTTPAMEIFAQDAVVYDNATAPGMWTLPSHAAMFTGLPGTTHGADASYRWLDGQHHTLAEILSGEGYATMAFSSNIIASPFTNLLQGFAAVQTTYPRRKSKRHPNFYEVPARRHTASKLIATDASTEISPAFAGSQADKWAAAIAKDAAPVMHRALMDFIDKRARERPWFAYLNMMEAHSPRIPSMAARKALLTDEQIALGLETDASVFAETEYIVGERDYTEAELDAMRGVYDAALLDLDSATGALLGELRDRGILDDTLVILVSDHGEALGEHRMLEHRWNMYDVLLHVPLIVRYPKRFSPGRVSERVSTIDVFATVLDVVGVEPPEAPGRRSQSLAGRAYDTHIHAQMRDPWAAQLGNIEEVYPSVDTSPWKRTFSAVYEGPLKYIHASDGAHELFDVHADPGELHNLIGEGDRHVPLAEELAAWEAGLEPYNVAGRTERDGPKKAGHGQNAMLESLGYVDDHDGGGEAEP